MAKIIPIFKNEETFDVNDGRQISVLSVTANVFEKIVFNQFYEFSSDNNLSSNEKSGFSRLGFSIPHSRLGINILFICLLTSNIKGKIYVAEFACGP